VWLRRIPHKLRIITSYVHAAIAAYIIGYCHRLSSVVCWSLCRSVSLSR